MLGLIVNSSFGMRDLIGEPRRLVVPTFVLSGLNILNFTCVVDVGLFES
jgi:hypothetical protein